MTPETPFSCRLLSHVLRVRRLLSATCVAACLLVVGLPVTGHAQSLDTSKLPRPAAIKQLVALPQATIILSSAPVPAATDAALALLEAAGWQRYTAPFSQAAPQPGSATHLLKKGAQALTLFVHLAPAHNNATSISYTEVPLTHDLPFPSKATDIRFSPERVHLDATAPLTHEALLAFYRAELTGSGWILHSPSDGSAAKQIPAGEGMHHAFFTHTKHGALHVTARKLEGGKSAVAVRAVPASVLPGAEVARAPEPQALEPATPRSNPQADAHAQMTRNVDAIAQDLMKQALQPAPKGAGVEAALEAARKAGINVNLPGKTASSGAANAVPAPEAAREVALERDEIGGMPVPKAASSKSQERTPWRVEIQATVKASPASVLTFYSRELAPLGWRETTPAKTEGARTVVAYASAAGPGVLTLEQKGGQVSISLLLRKEAEAQKSGLMPKPGQARIMFGSMLESDASVLIGGQTIKVAAGVGSKAPDGPSLEVAPGAHKVTIRNPGKPDVTEVVTVRANDIWGVLLGPGGALPLPMY